MKHWHRCERWTRRGLPCPFSGKDHAEIEVPAPEAPQEDAPIPPRLLVPAKRKAGRPRGKEKSLPRKLLIRLEKALNPSEVEEVMNDIPVPPKVSAPFPPAKVPAKVPARVGSRVPVRAPVRVPVRGRVPRGVEAFARAQEAARRAVIEGFRVQNPGPRLSARRRAAVVSEVATADTFGAGVKRGGFTRNRGIGAGVAGAAAFGAGFIGLRGRGGRGGGGFFVNQAARMRQLTAAPGARKFRQADPGL